MWIFDIAPRHGTLRPRPKTSHDRYTRSRDSAEDDLIQIYREIVVGIGLNVAVTNCAAVEVSYVEICYWVNLDWCVNHSCVLQRLYEHESSCVSSSW